MNLQVKDKSIEVNEQGFLLDANDWSEEFATEQANRDNIELYVDHWELIWYFRDYYAEKQTNPTMHTIVRDLGKKGTKFHEQKGYEKHIYKLFPTDPGREIAKLAGLPMPEADT